MKTTPIIKLVHVATLVASNWSISYKALLNNIIKKIMFTLFLKQRQRNQHPFRKKCSNIHKEIKLSTDIYFCIVFRVTLQTRLGDKIFMQPPTPSSSGRFSFSLSKSDASSILSNPLNKIYNKIVEFFPNPRFLNGSALPSR